MYQLTTGNGMLQMPFVFFDNGAKGANPDDRLCVLVTLRVLQGQEYDRVYQQIEEQCGREALVRRHQQGGSDRPKLEFMKYFIVFHGTGRPVCIMDMDTGEELDPTLMSEKYMAAAQPPHLPPRQGHTEQHQGGGMRGTAPMHAREHAWTSQTRVFETISHGAVRFTVSQFENPDVRNGISIHTSKPVTRENAYGALVLAVAPRKLTCTKYLRVPPAPPSIAALNQDDYYVSREGTFQDGGGRHQMLVPRGGAGSKYIRVV